MSDALHPDLLHGIGEKPLTNYWLFNAGVATSVAASSSIQIVTTTQGVPIVARGLGRLLTAFSSISVSDSARQLVLDAVALFLICMDGGGVTIGSTPLPVQMAAPLPATLPGIPGTAIRAVSADTPERLDVIPAFTMLPSGKTAAQVGIQAIVIARNLDGAGAHSCTVSAGGIVGTW